MTSELLNWQLFAKDKDGNLFQLGSNASFSKKGALNLCAEEAKRRKLLKGLTFFAVDITARTRRV